MSKRTMSIAEDLRTAIAQAERRGMTRYAIAKAAKMPRSQLTRIASGETVPKLDTAERIALVIGCRVAIVPIVAK
jgi:transcriptional regulator with XRE-family HTH domain